MAGVLAALAALVGSTGAASAHPLGNFTINHYAGVRIESDLVLLDVVIDEAEIPAFQSRQAVDIDEDGELSADELRDGSLERCRDGPGPGWNGRSVGGLSLGQCGARAPFVLVTPVPLRGRTYSRSSALAWNWVPTSG